MDVSITGLQRAYSLLHVKAVDTEKREFSGIATTPTPDRVGDVVEPKGVTFQNPLTLLLYHDHKLPVGEVKFGKPTDDGVPFTARIPDIPEPGTLRERVNEAWHSVKYGVIKGVSIGFKALDDGIELLRSGGYRFTKTEVLELSLVSVPANAEATIHTLKSLDAPHLAASGNGASTDTLRDRGTHGVTARKDARTMTIHERKSAFLAEKEAKVQKLNALMDGDDAGTTLDAEKQEEFDTLVSEIEAIDKHLARLETQERINKTKPVKPVEGESVKKASDSRDTERLPVITTRENVPPGIGFARAVMCMTQAKLDNWNVIELAKRRYPSHETLHKFLEIKATVPAGTTTQTVYAEPLVYATNLASEFIEFLRPQTILGKFGMNGIPSLTRVPFKIRVPRQTSGGHADWVGQGAGKPVTSMAFDSVSLDHNKVATIAVLTKELVRLSSPSAEMLVRNTLAGAVNERLDIDFTDPSVAVSSGVNPASITNGLTALTTAGTTADNARTDVGVILKAFLEANKNTANLVFIMPNTLAMSLALLRNSLGQREFPDLNVNGGFLEGIPVITSQYVANSSGYGNLVIAVKADEIFLADDGNVSIDVSEQASVQMSDAPTVNSTSGTGASLVSLWQTNSVGIRAEREISWTKARTDAVVYMDDVNWGSIGSPS